jgi:hypothetical protein
MTLVEIIEGFTDGFRRMKSPHLDAGRVSFARKLADVTAEVRAYASISLYPVDTILPREFEAEIGGESVLSINHDRYLSVVGVDSRGRLRGRSFALSTIALSGKTPQAALAPLWERAKMSTGDVVIDDPHYAGRGQKMRAELCLGGTLRRLGLTSNSTGFEFTHGVREAFSKNLQAEKSRLPSAVFNRIVAAADTTAIAALENVSGFSAAQYDWIASGSEFSGRRTSLMTAFRYAAGTLSRCGAATDAAFARGAEDADVLLAALIADSQIPGEAVAKPNGLSRVRAMIASTAGVLRPNFRGVADVLALKLPAERIPNTAENWTAFHDLHMLAKRMTSFGGGGMSKLMDIAKGD